MDFLMPIKHLRTNGAGYNIVLLRAYSFFTLTLLAVLFSKLSSETEAIWGSSTSPSSESKMTFSSVRLDISVHPISSLADQGTLWTWPQRPTCRPQCASLRTLKGNWWLIRKLWRSCQAPRILSWWWLSWASTAQANPTWWTSWLGRTRVSGTKKLLGVPSVHLHCLHWTWWCKDRKLENAEEYWKLSFNTRLCSYLHCNLKESVHHSSHFALVSSFKSINCSFPRKTSAVIKIINVHNKTFTKMFM